MERRKIKNIFIYSKNKFLNILGFGIMIFYHFDILKRYLFITLFGKYNMRKVEGCYIGQ